MRVLLIEDDIKIASVIGRGLKAESFAVDIAPDGVIGEELAKINEYDVIILDLMLPRQDGLTTCANLRKDKVFIPVLMLTALDDVSDKIEGLNKGADDYLAKPFHFGELLARVRSLIRRNSHVRTTEIEKYGVKLNLENHIAYRENKKIILSAKEFALLELFMMNPGRILTREVISEHMWDMNFDPRSNVIESFVKYLRQKIDRDFEKPLIHTVRGAGYLFSEKGR